MLAIWRESEEIDCESLWAKPVGGQLFQIHSIPFFVPQINCMDVVRVDENLVVQGIESRGEWLTYWVAFNDVDLEVQRNACVIWKKLGLPYERFSDRYLSICTPKGESAGKLLEHLKLLERESLAEWSSPMAEETPVFLGEGV